MWTIFVAAALAAMFWFLNFYKDSDNPSVTLRVGNTELNVEIADSPEERQQGLSGRDKLPNNQGMLFIFESEGLYNFWMKDMKFPIDIVWIDSSGRIIYLKENIGPDTYPELFSPDKPARYVLEVNAGWVAKNSIAIGNTLHFK